MFLLHYFISFQQFTIKSCRSTDCISQFSVDSYTSVDSKDPVYIAAGDIRRRLSQNMAPKKSKFEVHRILICTIHVDTGVSFVVYTHNGNT